MAPHRPDYLNDLHGWSVRLIKYDFEKYGKSAERRRLLKRWNKEVGSLSK